MQTDPQAETSDDSPQHEDWKSFRGLLAVQTLNAFNDNIVKFLLLGVGAASLFSIAGLPFEHLLSALAAGAFILFSPISGWASDRYSKRGVIVFSMWMQLVCFLIIAASLQLQWMWGAVIGFFLISIQSVVFAPAKLGIIKELLGSKRLGAASGWMQMLVIVAIIIGSAIGGIAYKMLVPEYGIWSAAAFPMAGLFAISIIAVVLSRAIAITPPHDPKPFGVEIIAKQFTYLIELFGEKRQRRSSLGKAYFWGIGIFVFLVVTQKARETTDPENVSSIAGQMMACMGLGAAIGGGVAAVLSRNRIQLGLIPVGGAGLALMLVLLGIVDQPRTWQYATVLVFLGVAGSFFLTPLNAYLQDVCHPERRGRMLAASSMLDALFNVLFVGIQLALAGWLGYSTATQLYIAGAVTALATLYTARLLPVDTIKAIILPWMRLIYGVRSIHSDRIPETGPVLIVANHVSYIDAFIISSSCHRPVRFLMMQKFYDMRWANWLFRATGAIPIDTENGSASGAIKACVDSLNAGDVVCIFPEGGLTRDGELNEFKRGMEIIAKRSGAPVLPVAMSGVFGSFFSHWGRGLMKGRPKQLPLKVRVTYGVPIPADHATAAESQEIIAKMLAESGE